MTPFSVVWRYAKLFLFFALPWACAGALLGGKIGFALGVSLGVVVFGVLGLWGERWMERFHAPTQLAGGAVQESFRRAFERVPRQKRRRTPRVMVFQDVAPHAFVARQWFSVGTVFLSQGLLASANEAEVRVVFESALKQLSSRGIGVRTMGAVAAALILKLAPHEWVEICFLQRASTVGATPSRTIFFAAILAASRFCLSVSEGGKHPVQRPQPMISQATPGAAQLYII